MADIDSIEIVGGIGEPEVSVTESGVRTIEILKEGEYEKEVLLSEVTVSDQIDQPEIIEIVSGIGPMPDHQIDAGSVRFQKPDGSWGEWIETGEGVDWEVDQEGDHYIHKNNIKAIDGGYFT